MPVKAMKAPVRAKRSKAEMQQEFAEIQEQVESARETADAKAEGAARLHAARRLHHVFYYQLFTDTEIFQKAVFSIQLCIFRTWVPPVGYTSRESLNRHYFLVCNDVLQHLHPLPEDRENRVTPTSKTLAQQQDGRRRGPAFHHRREPLPA